MMSRLDFLKYCKQRWGFLHFIAGLIFFRSLSFSGILQEAIAVKELYNVIHVLILRT